MTLEDVMLKIETEAKRSERYREMNEKAGPAGEQPAMFWRGYQKALKDAYAMLLGCDVVELAQDNASPADGLSCNPRMKGQIERRVLARARARCLLVDVPEEKDA